MRMNQSLTALVMAFTGIFLCVPAQAQRQATATASIDHNGGVTTITVTDGGAGYIVPPAITISGGGGSGATATAVLVGDAVSQINVVSPGDFYAAVPDVIIGLPDVQPTILALETVPRLTIYGLVGSTNQVQWVNAFGDTNVWAVLTNVVLPTNPFVFYDTFSPPGSRRFYRSVVNGGGARPAAPVGFVWLPAGRFTMGGPDTEQDRGNDEGPQTAVTLSAGFFLCSHLVTQGEYSAVVGINPSVNLGDLSRPVDTVSWSDAISYCATLTDQERSAGRLPSGYAYQLPTEAQWEYAARAATTTRFSFGDDPGYTNITNYAWYDANSEATPHPVATKRPNRWGLYDMGGLAWEWCSVWYGAYPGGSVTDPKGPATGSDRAVRGGSSDHVPQYCRSAQRNHASPGFRNFNLGFRVALVPVP